MENDPQKSKLSQLLERLQEESWQLELLISGFAIFLVSAMKEPIEEWLVDATVTSSGLSGSQYLMIPFMILIGAWLFLLINLIMHVVLRGFWIAAIGLRYISGDIDFEKLNMAPKFDRYLRARIPSFDLFIEKLEKLCSVVFAFTFLIIFSIISLGLFILFMFFIGSFLKPFLENNASDPARKILLVGILGVFLFSGVLYFIDFITLGWLKRKKWLSLVYYPIYRFYSVITLSFLYRPLYYNLIDNKFGKRVGLFIVPYIISVVMITSIQTDAFLYFPNTNSTLELKSNQYGTNLKNEDRVTSAIIPDKIITSGFLELFIPYFATINKSIEVICPDLIADKQVGTRFAAITFGKDLTHHSPVDSLLLCVSSAYKIRLDDSLYQNIDFMFHKHIHAEEPGLITLIDIDHLKRGKHVVLVETARLEAKSDSLYYKTRYTIPFWKE